MVTIVFFSGTGGVKRIASEFRRQLPDRFTDTAVFELDYSKGPVEFGSIDEHVSHSSLLFLLFPVHAFDAPDPIYRWIENTNSFNKKTVVVSVSGGGEIWPNTGTRARCISALAKKGYTVCYESMMVMPSNWVTTSNDHLSMWLLRSIPEKVRKILSDVTSGREIRSHRWRIDILQRLIGKLEKWGARSFGKTLEITDKCTRCGWCASNCPTGNIRRDEGTGAPVFSERCVMCFRCVYGCPSRALESSNFMVIKSGYDLIALEKRMAGVDLQPLDVCGRGILWKGVVRYLRR